MDQVSGDNSITTRVDSGLTPGLKKSPHQPLACSTGTWPPARGCQAAARYRTEAGGRRDPATGRELLIELREFGDPIGPADVGDLGHVGGGRRLLAGALPTKVNYILHNYIICAINYFYFI